MRTADGTVLGEFDWAEYENMMHPSQDVEDLTWSILTTADGVNIANESVAEWVGVADAEISGVRVNSVGRQLIVSVVLQDEVSPGVKRQLILVGTPDE